MIISASYKTDIPAFYGDWFRARRLAGHCHVKNAWSGRDFKVSLRDADCSGFVFWTRNARPFRSELARTARTHPFLLQYTVTGLPRWLERSVLPPEEACADIAAITAQYGGDAVVWRYDPILLTDQTPPDWHVETFTRLSRQLSGRVNEVVVSFAQIYRKTRRNLNAATTRAAATWRDPDLAEKAELLEQLSGIASSYGMHLTACAQPALSPGFAPAARCIDAARLNRVAAQRGHAPLTARTKGPRPGCLCAESRDIGAYNTCAHGCVYCYAVDDPVAARRAHRAHDATAENLSPAPVPKIPAEASRS